MHNIKDIRNDLETFKEALNKRFVNIDLNKILSLDENNRKHIQEREALEREKKSSLNLKINLFLKNLKIFLKKLTKLIKYKLMLRKN
tara:strand:+ start:40 stop:300 length:261 start_codon:yes stop_codon:yes gene_type:complete